MLVRSQNGTHIKEGNETGSKCIKQFFACFATLRKCSVSVGNSYLDDPWKLEICVILSSENGPEFFNIYIYMYIYIHYMYIYMYM